MTQKERRSLHERINSLKRIAWKEKYSWILIQGKEDRAIKDCFEKYLLCTLYQVEFILSSFKVVISHTCLIWPTSDWACGSWNIQIYFWIWYEQILTFMSGKKYETIPAWRGKVDIVLILHGGRKLWWLICWSIPHWEKSLE